MAYLCIVVNDSLNSIAQLNAKSLDLANDSLNGHYAVALLQNYLNGLQAGSVSAPTVQVTTRSTDPAVATVGTGSAQISYTTFA